MRSMCAQLEAALQEAALRKEAAIIWAVPGYLTGLGRRRFGAIEDQFFLPSCYSNSTTLSGSADKIPKNMTKEH